MAFVAANSHILARELWPVGIGKLQQDKHLDLLSLRDSRVVPRDAEDLLEWLFVQVVERGRRAIVYLHPSVEGAEGSPQLVLRLQGVIEETNMGLYGDWDQSDVNAKKATQKLVLGSGGCKEAFLPQVKTLNSIRDTVSKMVGVCPKGVALGDTLVLKRRVFTKVNVETPPSVVTYKEDPSGLLEDMDDKWRIVCRIKCGEENATGGIEPLHALSLQRGDLVDVSVTVVAAISDGPQGRRCDVIFERKTIVRLATSQVVQDAFKEAQRAEAMTRRRATSYRDAMEEGFAFTEKRRRGHDGNAVNRKAPERAEVEKKAVGVRIGDESERPGEEEDDVELSATVIGVTLQEESYGGVSA